MTRSPEDRDGGLSERPPLTDSWAACMRAGLRQMGNGGSARKAASCFRRALALRQDHLTTHLNLGAALLRAGEYAQALRCYDEIADRHPGLASARHGRGLAFDGLNDRQAALEAFRAATGIDEGAWQSWASIADVTPDEDERQLAIIRTAVALERACKARSVSPALLVRCSDALNNARRYADAVQFIHGNRRSFPDAAIACNGLARANYRLGAFTAAFQYQKQALRLLTAPGAPKKSERSRPFAPDAALAALRDITSILKAAGVRPFLAAGTLLGLHRDGTLLAHDRDVDIGVIREADGLPDIVSIVREHPALRLRHHQRPADRYIGLEYRGVAIDIFVHDQAAGALVCGMSDLPGDIQWRFRRFGLAKAIHAGHDWLVPDAPERYLAETYGPGWRQPDPGFASAVSSPALNGVDLFARSFYALARAQQAWLSGNRTKALKVLQQSPVPIRRIPAAIRSTVSGNGGGPRSTANREA